MAFQQDVPLPLIGAEVDASDRDRLLRLVRLFLAEDETVRALVTTVKALPKLTHVAVTDRRVVGFFAPDIAREGLRQEVPLTRVAKAETRPSYKGRWFLVTFDANGQEEDFGDVHEDDAPRVLELIKEPSPPQHTPPQPPPPQAAPPQPAPPPAVPPQAAPPQPVPPQGAPPQPAPSAAPALVPPSPPAPVPPAPLPPAPVPAPAGPLPPVPPAAPPSGPVPGPPAPGGWAFNTPPGWPVPPDGWTPPPGWRPDPGWAPAPAGWRFWVPTAPSGPVRPPERSERRPVFGAKKQRIEDLEAETAWLRQELARVGALEAVELAEETERLRAEADEQRRRSDTERGELERVRRAIVETQDVALLQEAGVYEYQHPLADAVAYKSELTKIKDKIKATARNGQAVVGATDWQVNGSSAEGARMVRDFSKLMLRAYNAEADNLVRTMRPYKLQSAIDRLDKSAQTIERLGRTMHIRVSPSYRTLRIKELRLTADHLAKTEEEKERVRAERERQREEEKAAKEFEREKARLLKERSHVESALAKLEARGDTEGAAELRSKLGEVDSAISDVEGRAANIRAGYVYVISNIGAFGERMVKIGMTRRLEPMDRVRELGDASVPFRFDVHALIFSDDAVGLEGRLHEAFAAKRVNQVNLRREFFYATPAEVRNALERLAGNHLLEYTENPEALEWRASRSGA